jgi:glucose-6-phosphate 1-dehydrogenase
VTAGAATENPLVESLERLPARPTTLVILGGTGDLAQRKLLPGIYNLAHEGALPERFFLLGVARGELHELLVHAAYLEGSFDDHRLYEALAPALARRDDEAGQRRSWSSCAPVSEWRSTSWIREARSAASRSRWAS